LVKEGHWKVAKVEQSRVNVAALLELLEKSTALAFPKIDSGGYFRRLPKLRSS
jgi:hypothetical protein